MKVWKTASLLEVNFLNFSVKQEECDLLSDGVIFFPSLLIYTQFIPSKNSYQSPNVVDAYQHSVPVCSRISHTTNIIKGMTFLPVQKTRCWSL